MKYLKYLTGIGTISILIGIIYNYIYYIAFSINIFDYVSLSETLILFDEFIPFIVTITLITWTLPLILDNMVKDLDNDNEESNLDEFKPYIDKEGFWARFKEHLGINVKLLIIFIILGLALLTVKIASRFSEVKVDTRAEILSLLLLFPILYFVINYFKYEFFDRVSRIIRKRMSHSVELVAHFIVFIIPIFIIYCSVSIKSVYWEPLENKSVYMKTNEIIKTGKDLKYLGQTENYMFFRNIITNTSYVYMMDNIDRIETQDR